MLLLLLLLLQQLLLRTNHPMLLLLLRTNNPMLLLLLHTNHQMLQQQAQVLRVSSPAGSATLSCLKLLRALPWC
jgi:hypothetical protein